MSNVDVYGTAGTSFSASGSKTINVPVSATSGNNTVVAAVPGRSIRVLACHLVANNIETVQWFSSPSSTALTGAVFPAQYGGYVLGFHPSGWFQTVQGEALVLNVSGGNMGGSVTYVIA